MCKNFCDRPDDRLSSFSVLSGILTISEAEIESAVGTVDSVFLESAQFAFEKQLEVTFSEDSGHTEFSGEVLPELFRKARNLAFLKLL